MIFGVGRKTTECAKKVEVNLNKLGSLFVVKIHNMLLTVLYWKLSRIYLKKQTFQINGQKSNKVKKSLHDDLYSTTVYTSTVYKITIKKPLWKVYIHL